MWFDAGGGRECWPRSLESKHRAGNTRLSIDPAIEETPATMRTFSYAILNQLRKALAHSSTALDVY